MTSFADALQITRGVTAIIGGGGKTSLLYRLADELRTRGSVIVATSTHIWPPAHLPFSERAGRVSDVLCVGTPGDSGKLAAPAQSFSELARLADFLLVEADGSAGRPLKAHLPHEPVVPICEAAHRPERFAALAGAAVTDAATPEMAARVLNAEALHTRVLLNQADAPGGTEAAKQLIKLLNCPVITASLQKGEIICSF